MSPTAPSRTIRIERGARVEEKGVTGEVQTTSPVRGALAPLRVVCHDLARGDWRMKSLEPWFLEILACPICHGRVTPAPAEDGLVCAACALLYPVEDGIPQMLPDSGRPLSTPGEARPAPSE